MGIDRGPSTFGLPTQKKGKEKRKGEEGRGGEGTGGRDEEKKEQKEFIDAKPGVPISSGGQGRTITSSRPDWAAQ